MFLILNATFSHIFDRKPQILFRCARKTLDPPRPSALPSSIRLLLLLALHSAHCFTMLTSKRRRSLINDAFQVSTSFLNERFDSKYYLFCVISYVPSNLTSPCSLCRFFWVVARISTPERSIRQWVLIRLLCLIVDLSSKNSTNSRLSPHLQFLLDSCFHDEVTHVVQFDHISNQK